jgi:hypothetical protein
MPILASDEMSFSWGWRTYSGRGRLVYEGRLGRFSLWTSESLPLGTTVLLLVCPTVGSLGAMSQPTIIRQAVRGQRMPKLMLSPSQPAMELHVKEVLSIAHMARVVNVPNWS